MNYILYTQQGDVPSPQRTIQLPPNAAAARLQRRKQTSEFNDKEWELKLSDGGYIDTDEKIRGDINSYYVNNTRAQSPLESLELPNDNQKEQPMEESTETSSSTANDQVAAANWIDTYLKQLEQSESTEGNSGASTSTSTSATPATATQKASYKEVVDHLVSKGMTKEGAAGVAGVFMAESGLIAGRVNEAEDKKYGGQKAGKGLGQWSNSRRVEYNNFMQGKQTSIQNDLDFFIRDLEKRPHVKKVLFNTKSVEEAVKAMHLGYENGGDNSMATPEQLTATYTNSWRKLGIKRPYSYQDSHNKRFNYAQQAYNA